MAVLQRPILLSTKPFSADESCTFIFNYTGSSQAVVNNLVIERVANNQVVYDSNANIYSFRHILPANILLNGYEYRAKVRVGDASGNWSLFSDWSIFKVLSKPTITIDNIDYGNGNKVYNQVVVFNATYNQADNELLESYHFTLYDSSKSPLTVYSQVYVSDNSMPATMSQQIESLENGRTYHLEVTTISVSGAIGSSGLISFIPSFVAPKISTILSSELVRDEGAIKISANVLQMFGKVYDSDNALVTEIVYKDNNWLDLRDSSQSKVVFAEGFTVDSPNFMLQLWGRNLPEGIPFLTIHDSDGNRLQLEKLQNRIHAYKSYAWSNGSQRAHFASNVFVFNEDVDVTICLKHINNLIDIYVLEVVV